MPDYIYLLENRLSSDQQSAIRKTVDAARSHGLTVFLAGGAVRDFTSGFPVRDLDISVQGNALKLKKDLEKSGAAVYGTHEPSQTLLLKFPGGIRVEVSATRTERFPKPGKAEYHPASILDDLRRRDFTVNAMALSLNEGSYGLLLDPLNGVADIESRTIRLITNTGFYDDPSRLVRAARLISRYGWAMDDRTQQRYENAKTEDVISYISNYTKGYELEEIAHEEDALRVLKHLEAEGWMKALFPAWHASKADAGRLEELRETLHALQGQGINPDASAAHMQYLTAKLQPKDISALKKLLPAKGFVEEWESLDSDAKKFATALTGKDVATPSATWKLITSYRPEAVLWLAMTGKGAAIQTKFRNFFSVWPESRQRIPYAIMQEMRITPELPGYQDLQRELFYQFMDNKLKTEEEVRRFLEPYSPPAPPPPPSLRRPRPKKAAESKSRARKAAVPAQVKQHEAAAAPNPDAAGGPATPTSAERKLVDTKHPSAKIVADAKSALAAKEKTGNAPSETGKKSPKATPVVVKAAKKPAAKPPAKPVKKAVAKKAAPAKKMAKPAAKKAAPAKKSSAKKAAPQKPAARKMAPAKKKKR